MLPRDWGTAIGMSCKAATYLGVWWSKGENNMFEVVTFLAITTQSNRRSLTCPLLKGLVFQMAVSLPHPSWACSRAISEGPVHRCTIQKPSAEIPFPSHTSILLTACLCAVLYCCDFPAHPLLTIPLRPAESSLYPVGRILVSEVKKLPGCHNLSLAAILLHALMQTQAGLFRELLWFYLLLNVEMTLCTIPISGAARSSASHGQSGFIPSPSSETWAPHTDKRGAGSSVGLQSHIMLSSGVPSPPRNSQ